MRKKYLLLNKKVNNLLNNEYILEIYLFIMASIAVLGWTFNDIVGFIVLTSLAAIMLLITNDIKYIIPMVLYFPFVINSGFTSSDSPWGLVIVALVFVFIVLIYTIINKLHLKQCRSLPILLLMAINEAIPVFWLTASHDINYYFLYFSMFVFAFVYFIFANNKKTDMMDVAAKSFTYLAVILFIECAIKVNEIRISQPDVAILSLAYTLGWGICNESGIMICFSLPFIFYQLANKTKISLLLANSFKLAFAVLGIIITTSRGSYIFGFLICFFSYLVLAIKNKKFVLNNVVSLSITLTLILLFSGLLYFESHEGLIEQAWTKVFTLGLDNNGRVPLWEEGFKCFDTNFLTRMFGPGYVCVIRELWTPLNIVQSCQVIFHSTIIETLAIGGIVGLLFMIVHFYQKYTSLKYIDKSLALLLVIGFIYIDLYGLIDNTYYMHYYMMPLMILLASIDSSITGKNKKINYLF